MRPNVSGAGPVASGLHTEVRITRPLDKRVKPQTLHLALSCGVTLESRLVAQSGIRAARAGRSKQRSDMIPFGQPSGTEHALTCAKQ